LRLLTYFLERLSVFMEIIIRFIENNEKEKALKSLKNFIINIDKFSDQTIII